MLDCVVIGAGPAGLATSRALGDRGIDHVVLERGRVGASWQTQRWDSFRLNTPGWCNALLGDDQHHDAFAALPEVLDRLRALAATSPVREHVEVRRLRHAPGGFTLETTAGPVSTRTVVAATGDQNVPVAPRAAPGMPEDVAQLHAADYRNAAQLPAGVVLVVGAAQSGGQIAEDLRASGREVFLATSRVARFSWNYRGRPTLEWLVEAGFYDHRPADLPDPGLMRAPQPLVASGGRDLSLRTLARSGVRLVGRLRSIDGQRVSFESSAVDAIAAGDAGAARIRAVIDTMISARGLDAPPAELDPDEELEPPLSEPPAELDLRGAGVVAVVWCTGFVGDQSYLPAELLAADGTPLHVGAASPAPGLWFCGRKWLVRRDSGIMLGMAKDAALVGNAVREHLDF